ncbi:MAG: histidine phosphatase family protein [Nanoarchaeota archaeon]
MGETEENKLGIIQGHLPGHLSEKGIEQAERLALRLKDEVVDCIYSSDLARAADTAQEIARFHRDFPLRYVEDLREKFLADWEGKTKESLGFTATTSIAGMFPEGAETADAVFARAQKFMDAILADHADGTVLFVGHNVINKAIIAVITGRSAEAIASIENMHNTGVCEFTIEKEGKHTIVVFNCSKHLE